MKRVVKEQYLIGFGLNADRDTDVLYLLFSTLSERVCSRVVRHPSPLPYHKSTTKSSYGRIFSRFIF
jgi:hypothetical protein